MKSLSREKKPDLILLLVTLLLVTIGTVMIYSSSSILATEKFRDGQFFLKKQIFFLCLGLGVMVLTTRIPYYKLRKLAWPGIAASGILLCALWIPHLGIRAGGAVRWLNLGIFSFQVSEMAKVALILFLAHFLTENVNHVREFRQGMLVPLGVTGVLVGGCENIPRLRGNSIQAFLGDALGVPGFADNDATTAAAGELLFGAGRKYRNFVLITLGTGIGGGFVLDGKGEVPLQATLFSLPGRTIVATATMPPHKEEALASLGVEVWRVPGRGERVDLGALLRRLGEAAIDSLLVEGGSETAAAFLEAQLVDRVSFFVGPVILGGRTAVGAVGGLGAATLADGIRLCATESRRFGEDFLYTGLVERRSG